MALCIIRVRVEAWVDTRTEETDYLPQNGKGVDRMAKNIASASICGMAAESLVQ